MSDKKQYDLRTIDIGSIQENPVALRSVNKEAESYLNMVASVRSKGIMNPFSVRERTAVIDGVETSYFEICDGLHRYSAACDAGLTELPVNVVTFGDAQVLESQIIANVQRIETRPVEYTKQITRIFTANPALTMTEMAGKLAKSVTWVSQRLGLLKLGDKIGELVDDGKITVSNAVVLAKLPLDEQLNFVDSAMSMSSEEFVPTVQARVKELREALREGRAAKEYVFEPLARVQKFAVLKEEYSAPSVGPQLVAQQGITDPAAAFALGVAWAISLDPSSVDVQRANSDAKMQRKADEKKKRKADRANKKAEEAAKVAAEINSMD